MKIDVYSHLFPPAYFKRMCELAKDKGAIKRWLNVPVLYDIDARLRMLDEFPDQQQILTLSSPPNVLINQGLTVIFFIFVPSYVS